MFTCFNIESKTADKFLPRGEGIGNLELGIGRRLFIG
jgi:hypothetical protein